MRHRLLAALLCLCPLHLLHAGHPIVSVETPISPPAWALLERALLRANTAACREFARRHHDERGYLHGRTRSESGKIQQPPRCLRQAAMLSCIRRLLRGRIARESIPWKENDMTDTSSQRPIRVSADGTSSPYIMVSVDLLEQV